MSVERRVLTEFITLYKEFPCLWDNRNILYSNKEAKEHALEVMLEKYKQIQEEATIVDVKRRIENLRTCFRREHKKKLVSRLKGEDPEYEPTLWYYDMMTFLFDVMDFNKLSVENTENVFKVDYVEMEPPAKKRKSKLTRNLYLKDPIETNDSEDDLEQVDDSDMMQLSHDEDINTHGVQNISKHHTTQHFKPLSESEAFGTTLGLQLKELDSMQKVFAEKLISDVIFNARLQRLSENSNLTV